MNDQDAKMFCRRAAARQEIAALKRTIKRLEAVCDDEQHQLEGTLEADLELENAQCVAAYLRLVAQRIDPNDPND